MQFSNRITGQNDLDKTFLRLPASTRRKALMPALRAGATVIRNRASENVKQITSDEASGLLAKSLRVYTLRKYKGYYRVAVMVKKGAVNPRKKDKNGPVRIGLYGSVLEYGKKGQRPRSWIRKAIKEGKSDAFNAVSRESGLRMASAVMDARK